MREPQTGNYAIALAPVKPAQVRRSLTILTACQAVDHDGVAFRGDGDARARRPAPAARV